MMMVNSEETAENVLTLMGLRHLCALVSRDSEKQVRFGATEFETSVSLK